MKYKLLKDLPGCSAGAIFEKKVHGYTTTILLNDYIGFPSKVVETRTDWFEPVIERWKPKEGEMYYCLNGYDRIRCWTWDNSQADNEWFELGMCFRTESQAQEVSKAIKKLLVGFTY